MSSQSQSQPQFDITQPHSDWLESVFDEVQLPYAQTQQKDAVLFIVDCSESMRETFDDTSILKNTVKTESDKPQSTILTILHIIENAIKSKMIQSPDDYISIVLFGTKHKSVENNPNNMDNVYILNPIEQPNIELIKQLQYLQDSAEFDNTVGSYTIGQIDRVLQTSALLFNSKQNVLKYATKRIIIITNNDYPLDTTDKYAKNRCLQKARDLRENNVSIQCIAVKSRNRSFDPRKLMFRIENNITDTDERNQSPDGKLKQFEQLSEQSLQDLNQQISSKIFKQRTLGTLEFTLAPDICISVNVYALIHEIKRDTPVLLDKRTNQPVTTSTKYVDKVTGEYVDQKTQVKKYIEYAGEKVYFTDAEIQQIKTVGTVGLTLMGFKPSSTLLDQYNVRAPYFIYPTEKLFTGSSLLFHTLLEQMHTMQKIAICRVQYRRNSIARFVALVPQREQLDEYNNQIVPPGMHLIFLPYCDDIRDINVNAQYIASDEQIRACKTVIDKLTNIHDIPVINNPVLIRHNSIVQAVALEQSIDDVLQLPDESLPDVTGLRSKYSNVIEHYKQSVYGDSDGTATKSTGKRTKSDNTEHKVKKEKHNPTTADDDDERSTYESIGWLNEVQSNKLHKRTVPILKLYCKFNNLPVSGKKDDIVQRIVQHVQT